MVVRHDHSDGFAPRRFFARALGGLVLLALTTLPAYATLLPEGFFDMAPMANGTPAAVEANQMSYDGGTGMVAAEGAAVMSYDGFTLRADKIEYDQAKGSVRAVERPQYAELPVRDALPEPLPRSPPLPPDNPVQQRSDLFRGIIRPVHEQSLVVRGP